MSHFCVLVIGNNPESQLAKYDENLELDMHLVATREDLVKEKRQWIEDYKNGLYATYLENPEKYRKECSGKEGHLHFISEVFPKMLEWTDDECYEDEIRDYREYIDVGCSWCEIHDDGSLWKTTNDKAKWDWYQFGGRYRGLLKLKTQNLDAPLYGGWKHNDKPGDVEVLKSKGFCDQALVKDIDNLDELCTYAVVKDVEWYERGEMGWWGMATNEKNEDNWKSEFKSLLEGLQEDTLLTIVDCHI